MARRLPQGSPPGRRRVTYTLVIPADVRREIEAFPLHVRARLDGLFVDLREDPDRHTGPHGLEDTGPVRMRSAGRGGILAVVLISDLTVTVTLVRVTLPFGE